MLIIKTQSSASIIPAGTSIKTCCFVKTVDAKPKEKYKPGIWYNMPVEHRDYLSWAGSGVPSKEYFEYMENMLETFSKLK
ncbi:MAG: hypothetical protein PUD72_02140 [Oscillospiraceae bacterium]|nr:hypothetical protein [Oscillospiraceae bacterium]